MSCTKPFPVYALRCEQLRVISYLVVTHIGTSNKKRRTSVRLDFLLTKKEAIFSLLHYLIPIYTPLWIWIFEYVFFISFYVAYIACAVT